MRRSIVTGYVITANLEPASGTLTATAAVTFTALEEITAASFELNRACCRSPAVYIDKKHPLPTAARNARRWQPGQLSPEPMAKNPARRSHRHLRAAAAGSRARTPAHRRRAHRCHRRSDQRPALPWPLVPSSPAISPTVSPPRCTLTVPAGEIVVGSGALGSPASRSLGAGPSSTSSGPSRAFPAPSSLWRSSPDADPRPPAPASTSS